MRRPYKGLYKVRGGRFQDGVLSDKDLGKKKDTGKANPLKPKPPNPQTPKPPNP